MTLWANCKIPGHLRAMIRKKQVETIDLWAQGKIRSFAAYHFKNKKFGNPLKTLTFFEKFTKLSTFDQHFVKTFMVEEASRISTWISVSTNTAVLVEGK